jgi:hypothetical protein
MRRENGESSPEIALSLSNIRSETGGLGSAGITRLHGYYTPIRHP